MAGNLFGVEKIDKSTQIIEGRSYKFTNSLPHIQTSKHALSVLVPNITIFRIIFNGDTHFPKGKPANVPVLETIADDLQGVLPSSQIGDKEQKAWDKCMRITRKNGQAVLWRSQN